MVNYSFAATSESFNIGTIVGPLIIGACIAILLVGAVLVQCLNYFRAYPQDRRSIKAAVAVICSAEFTSFALLVSMLYSTLCEHYMDPTVFVHFPRQYIGFAILTALIQASVQGLFILRVKVMTRNAYIYTPCILFTGCRVIALLSLGCLMASQGIAAPATSFMDKWTWLIVFMLATALCGDLCIAVALSFCLWRKKSMTLNRHLINTLLLFVIQTGTLAVISTLAFLTTFLLYKHTWIWVGVSFVVPRVYSISLMGSLNGRNAVLLHRSNIPTAPPSIWENGISETRSVFSSASKEGTRGPISIQMQTSTDVEVDSIRGGVDLSKPFRSYNNRLSV
jgi:hypothetical protein